MSDRSEAHIRVGGKIDAQDLPELIICMLSDRLMVEASVGEIDHDFFLGAEGRGETLPELYAEDKCGGQLEHTEQFLIDRKIDHILWQDGHYAYDADIVYRVGGVERSFLRTVGGDDAITLIEIEKIVDTGRKEGEDVVKILDGILTIPELSPLEIVADVVGKQE